jgi:hypothetical protein
LVWLFSVAGSGVLGFGATRRLIGAQVAETGVSSVLAAEAGLSIPVPAIGRALVPGLVVAGPRAEITMIILQQGRAFESVGFPDEVFNGMILVVLVTVSVTPLILRRLLSRMQKAGSSFPRALYPRP